MPLLPTNLRQIWVTLLWNSSWRFATKTFYCTYQITTSFSSETPMTESSLNFLHFPNTWLMQQCNNFVLFFPVFGTTMLYLPYELALPLLIILEDQTIYLIAAFSCILISLSCYLHVNLICTIAHQRKISLIMA